MVVPGIMVFPSTSCNQYLVAATFFLLASIAYRLMFLPARGATECDVVGLEGADWIWLK